VPPHRRSKPAFVRVYWCLGCRFPRAVGFGKRDLDVALPEVVSVRREGECLGCSGELGFVLASYEAYQ
jgi:hypothetical protein